MGLENELRRVSSGMSSWDEAYRSRPPWDIGRPQPAFVQLVRRGELKQGKVLDAGCGTGENALFLAENGFQVIGIDLARDAVRAATAKAAARNLKAEFHIGNALDSDFRSDLFDYVIDSGLFHTFTDKERRVYAGQISRVLLKGGSYFMLCFSDKEPTNWGGPRRVTKTEIEDTFSPLFKINYIRDALFTTRIHDKGGKAYLTSATKIAGTVS